MLSIESEQKFYDEIKVVEDEKFRNFEKVEVLRRVFRFPGVFAFPD